MKKLTLLPILAATLFGCGSEPQGSAQDKETLDRLSREGMSPPPSGGGGSAAPATANQKGGVPGNPQPTGQVPPP